MAAHIDDTAQTYFRVSPGGVRTKRSGLQRADVGDRAAACYAGCCFTLTHVSAAATRGVTVGCVHPRVRKKSLRLSVCF